MTGSAATSATMCWRCNASYPARDKKCPVCGSINANLDLDAAETEATEYARQCEAISALSETRTIPEAAGNAERGGDTVAEQPAAARPDIEITPAMAAACERYYANWQRILGIHDRDKVQADCWSATHAMRAMLRAIPSGGVIVPREQLERWRLCLSQGDNAPRFELEKLLTTESVKT